MTDDDYQAGRHRHAGRVLIVSAIATFAAAIALWNGLVPFDVPEDLQRKLPAIFFFIGLLDVGLAIVMMRRGRRRS